MKKFLFSFVFLLISYIGFSQKGISYQAVIINPNAIPLAGEDVTGQPFVNGDVWMKFQLYNGSTLQFEEVQKTKTDAYGLVNLMIGSISSASFNSLIWDSSQKTLQVDVSFNQGASYTKISEQKLTYNPYSLFAETAGKLGATLPVSGGGTGATTAADVRANIGLKNVDNTADLDKPVSTATKTALNLKANSADVNSALALKANIENMSAALAAKADTGTIKAYVDTKIASANFTSTQGPSETILDANSTTKGKIQLAGDLGGTADAPTVPGLALKADVTDLSSLTTRINTNTTNIASNTTDISLKAPIASPTFTGTVSGISKSMVGLGSVDNTTDVGKPISTLTQAALDLKANASALTTLINTVNTNTTNITAETNRAIAAENTLTTSVNANTASITANANAITLKAPIASPTFTGTVSGISKSMVGLGSVDNISDAAKPVSTATQAALDLKANTSQFTTLTNTVNSNTASITAETNRAIAAENTLTTSVNANTASITANANAITLKAPIASPTFTGTVAVGTTSPSASSVVDISSASQGVLLPRMTTTQRDNIISPSNSLLIFNTTNNTFEVYKSACSCWVTINDGGNTSASNKLNTAPEASFLNYKGSFRPTGTAEIFYTYVDADSDAEGGTSFFWEIANDANGASKTTLSTGATATFLANQAGKYVRAIVTPRATKGLINGDNYYGAWTLIESTTIPFASGVSITGTAAQGNLLTGNYTFNGGSGTENGAGSTYIWQSATSSTGTNAQTIAIPNGDSAFEKTLIPTFKEINKFVRFGVNAKDNASLASTNNYVYSNWVGPITLGQEVAPIVKNVIYSPNPATNIMLTANYSYYDANNDAEGASSYQWYTATDVNGANKTPISGANAKQFTPTNAEDGKYIGLGVTAKALTGNITGTEVVYYNANPTNSFAQYTIAPNAISPGSNNFYSGRIMNSTDKIIAKVNVLSAGKLSFRTNAVNGYSFSADGTYGPGEQNIILTASGTQTNYNSLGDNFTLTITGNTISTLTTKISNAKLGSQSTNHFNGILDGVHNTTNTNDDTYYLKTSYLTGQPFSNQSNCSSKPISASACLGTTITIGSNTYSITNINGQCWMQQNLKELPYGNPINTSSLSLGGATNSDIGAFGFFNTISGANTWGTVEPAPGEGMLYQWSAAMEGATNERAKGVCPTGWHIPSDCEFLYLEHGLGLSIADQTANSRGNTPADGNIGSKLSSAALQGTNSSGFTGLMAGRMQFGGFTVRGTVTNFWSSTNFDNTRAINSTTLENTKNNTNRSPETIKYVGFSVRCLQD